MSSAEPHSGEGRRQYCFGGFTLDLEGGLLRHDGEEAILDQLVPEPERRPDGRGRPCRPRRDVLNGILYILRTGAPWAVLLGALSSLPNLSSSVPAMGALRCHARRTGSPSRRPAMFAVNSTSVKLSLMEASLPQKGGTGVGKTKRVKGPRSWQWQTALVCLLPCVESLPRHTK